MRIVLQTLKNLVKLLFKVGGKMPIYVADFETTTNPEDCRVWLWCMVNIDNERDIHFGNCIETFIDLVSTKNATYYFHNLKFDGKFILDYVLRELHFKEVEYETKQDRKGKLYKKAIRDDNTFSTIISDTDQFYEICLNFSKKRNTYYCARFHDSMKKFGMGVSVSDIAKSYEVGGIQKLDIDYVADRPYGYQPTEQEIQYVINDVLIVSRALNILYEKELDGLTIGSDALKYYKNNTKRFSDLFPSLSLEIDDEIRKAYKGGYCYCNKHIQNREVYGGKSYDVNSLYPYCMTLPLPHGIPIKYQGKYKPHDIFDLYIQEITCEFKIKDGYLPTIQLKKNRNGYLPTEYISQSQGETTFWLTSVDLELFFEHYDVYRLKWGAGYMFQSSDRLFADYINYWYDIKCNSKGSVKQMAKLMLNNLYGKFAQSTKRFSKTPYIGEDDLLRFKLNEPEDLAPVYTAVAAFITSYGRAITIRTAQAIGGDRKDSGFYYCDTDSIHCSLKVDFEKDHDVDNKRLGAWKFEYEFGLAKYIRPKAYIECLPDGENIIKCSGMTEKMKESLTYSDFNVGFEGSRLRAKTVKGGVVLIDSPFSIKGVDSK